MHVTIITGRRISARVILIADRMIIGVMYISIFRRRDRRREGGLDRMLWGWMDRLGLVSCICLLFVFWGFGGLFGELFGVLMK